MLNLLRRLIDSAFYTAFDLKVLRYGILNVSDSVTVLIKTGVLALACWVSKMLSIPFSCKPLYETMRLNFTITKMTSNPKFYHKYLDLPFEIEKPPIDFTVKPEWALIVDINFKYRNKDIESWSFQFRFDMWQI